MAYKITISNAANKDLNEIIDYIASHLLNSIAAKALLDDIEDKYGQLKEFPYMFERSNDKILNEKGYRKIVVKNYVVLYLIDESNKEINIMRFFYCGQKYEKYI